MAVGGMTVFTNEGNDYFLNDKNIADEFSSSVSYAAGDYCYYKGDLVRFLSAHSGAWTGEDIENVVFSTKIKDLFSSFKQGYTKEEIDFSVSGKYIDTDGDEHSNSSWKCSGFLPIYGETMIVSGSFNYLGTSGYDVALYDINKTFLRGYVTISTDGLLVDCSGAAYARFSKRDNNTTPSYRMLLDYWRQDVFEEGLMRLKAAIFSEVGYIQTNGLINESGSDWNTTRFIPVQGSQIMLSGIFYSLGANGCNVAVYDENKRFLRGESLGTVEMYKVDISDAAYIRLSSHSPKLNIKFWYEEPVRRGKNLIDRNERVNDYYVDYSTGNLYANEGYAVTDFIPILPGRHYTYTVALDIGGEYAVQQCAFYDKFHKYVSGMNSANTNYVTFAAPANAYYVRWTFKKNNYRKIQLEEGKNSTAFFKYRAPKDLDKEVIVATDGTGDFSSLLEALKETPDNARIRLRSGTYNVITEYEEYYGSTFFETYEGYSGVSDPFYRGMWMGQGREIRGDSGAVIRCLYTGDNNYVATLFSAIANAGNTLLENVTIEHSNLRYAIHDDYNPTDSTVVWRDITFDGTSTGAPIGAGLGVRTTYFIEGCVFKNNRREWDYNCHGANAQVADNKCVIRVRDCLGDKKVGVWPNGPSTTVSEVYVSNCKFAEILLYRPEGQDPSQYMNMALTKWLNEEDT